MSQIRYVNFGDTLTSSLIGTLNSTLAVPGRYIGYDVVVIDAQTIELQNIAAPAGRVGYCLLPDGVIVSESGPLRLTFPVFPNTATTYTIIARHIDSQIFGGTAVTYELHVGFVAQSSLTDGTVISWVYYPGGGVGLSQYQIVQPSKERLDSFVEIADQRTPLVLTAPFPDSITTVALHHTVATTTGSLSPLQSGTGWPMVSVTSAFNTVGTETTSFVFPRVLGVKPSRVDFTAKIDTGCNMQVLVTDSLGNTVAINPSSAFSGANPAVWARYTVRIPPYTLIPPYVANGTWAADTMWRLELRVNQPLSKQSFLGSLVCYFDPTLAVA